MAHFVMVIITSLPQTLESNLDTCMATVVAAILDPAAEL